MSKNKNKLYNNFSFTVNRYAPESFQLYFNGQLIKLSDQTRSKMGYAALTEGKLALLKLIKQWVRRNSNMTINPKKHILAILSHDKKEFYYISVPVDRYDIKSKLYVYQAIKEAFNAGRFSTKTQTAKLDANFKPYDVKEETYNQRLGNRIVFI